MPKWTLLIVGFLTFFLGLVNLYLIMVVGIFYPELPMPAEIYGRAGFPAWFSLLMPLLGILIGALAIRLSSWID